jgi:hypothetical protein
VSALEDFENAHAAIKEDVARRILETVEKDSGKPLCAGPCKDCFVYC